MENYRTLAEIGRGTQGTVFTVRHTGDGAVYVLKRVHIVEAEARRSAFVEVETMMRLQHSAVVGYRDTFIDGEYLCTVMEHCEGGDLSSRISTCRERPFTEDQILQWLVQLALALHHVHERGVLHRDLKTQNVFITGQGHLKLGDFGISKLLAPHALLAATCAPAPPASRARDPALATSRSPLLPIRPQMLSHALPPRARCRHAVLHVARALPWRAVRRQG